MKGLNFVLFTTFIESNFIRIGFTLAVNVRVAVGALACVSVDVIIALTAVLTRIAFTFVDINCGITQTDNEYTDYLVKIVIKHTYINIPTQSKE